MKHWSFYVGAIVGTAASAVCVVVPIVRGPNATVHDLLLSWYALSPAYAAIGWMISIMALRKAQAGDDCRDMKDCVMLVLSGLLWALAFLVTHLWTPLLWVYISGFFIFPLWKSVSNSTGWLVIVVVLCWSATVILNDVRAMVSGAHLRSRSSNAGRHGGS